jgi:hippurate hydrolase
MNLAPAIVDFSKELTLIRRDIHAHPEIGFEENRTSQIVADNLQAWGAEVHRSIGGTGVVGVINGKGPGRRIGLRADMDALPMAEATGLSHASKTPGVFHGCGHDGHTTMLLGAARHLASTRNFAGQIVLIFQPAEEGLGGARRMIADGLFDRFPCDEIYGLHNWPGAPLGRISLTRGVAMAAADTFDIHISGRGAHGAQPHHSVDPIMVATAIAQALQTIVSRNVDAVKSAIVSITQIHAGSAYNVIPETAFLGGTIRTFEPAVRDLIAQRITSLALSIAEGFGAEATVAIEPRFSALRNDDRLAEAAMQVAAEIVGPTLAEYDELPKTGSEDFAEMLAIVPGAYLLLGQGEGPALHNPRYDFNDAAIPIGATLLARLAEARA